MTMRTLLCITIGAALICSIVFADHKAKWEKPFDEQRTAEGDFHVKENVTVKVPFMSKVSFLEIAVLDDATVVSLPYKGNASAIFILSKDGKTKQVESNLHDIMRKWKASARTTLVDLSIPKFWNSGSLDLKEILPNFGIVDVSSNRTDLSEITGAPNMEISEAHHKSQIHVEEKGREKKERMRREDAGTTAMKAPEIKFNRPFIITTYDPEGKPVLFFSKFPNPAAK